MGQTLSEPVVEKVRGIYVAFGLEFLSLGALSSLSDCFGEVIIL